MMPKEVLTLRHQHRHKTRGRRKQYVDVDEDLTVEEDPAPPQKDKGKQRQVDDNEANPKVWPLAMQPERKCLVKNSGQPCKHTCKRCLQTKRKCYNQAGVGLACYSGTKQKMRCEEVSHFEDADTTTPPSCLAHPAKRPAPEPSSQVTPPHKKQVVKK